VNEPCPRCGLLHPPTRPCPTMALATVGGDSVLLSVGVQLAGRYQILKVIHRGGMSAVYLAQDTVSHRGVALKELRLDTASTEEERQEAEAWFARESYVLSNMSHPLIPGFYSVFREGGRAYIAQEFIDGENLNEYVHLNGPVSVHLVLKWASELCGLLQYLHTRREPVVHRDVKPANMILSYDAEQLTVVDFGIAKPMKLGQVGTTIGTPGYAPPEQYQGIATPESDIYALGVTLHRLLTAHDPEQSDPSTVLFTLPDIRTFRRDVPPRLVEVIGRATQLDPRARYATAWELGRALESAGKWATAQKLARAVRWGGH
jgi:serine/threonine protein kinase